MKILISAYACEPDKGSEPGVGWNAAIGLSKHNEIWVITRENNKPSIEAFLQDNPLPNLHFIYYDLPKVLRWWKRGQQGVRIYYYLWQIGIYFLARKLISQINFNFVHHITFVNYYRPSFLSLLPVPFIFGPVGGGESAPKSFWLSFGWYGFVFECIREFSRWLSEHDPFLRITVKRSLLVFATTDDTALRLKRLGAKRVEILSEAALKEKDLMYLKLNRESNRQKFIFISIGRLLHLKGFFLGMEAFSKLSDDNLEYWIIGDGPDRKRLEKIVKKNRLQSKIRLFGQLSRDETLDLLKKADVLVHPSLHDSGGWVCLEAMACGNPVICFDIGGPGQQVTSKTGAKVPAINKEHAVVELAKAMSFMVQNKSKYSEQAIAHINENYKLEIQQQKINNSYNNLSIK